MVYIPRSKHLHILASLVNAFFKQLGPKVVLEPIPLEEQETFGVSKIQDFTWKDLLEEGPRLLANKAETSSESEAKTQARTMIGDVVTEEEIWACTTCGACQEVCPVNIEHIRKIIDLRRNLVLSQGKMPESAQLMLRNMQSRGHPWAGVQSMR